MPKILIETRLNSLKLNEDHAPRKGCLGRIEGICADYANPTRNGRFYPRELWENVFNDDLIKESLESKTLIGELDHPEERFEPLAKEACVVMTDYRFDDDKKVVWGGFDVLDTPAGRILKSLLDYGCVMGVSSRGQGDIINNGQYEEVSPDTYEFACFDVVTTPAVMSARQKVTEGVHKQKIKGLNESIIEQVNNSTTNSELDTILRVVESTGLSNLSAVKKAIKDKRKSIVEGKTISEKTKEDLHKAKIQVNQLQKQLDEQSAKTIREQRELQSATSTLTSQVLAYKHREEKLMETIDSLKSTISSQKEAISSKRSSIVENRKTIENLQLTIESLEKSLEKSVAKYEAVLNNESALRAQITESAEREEELTNKLAEKDAKISELNESVKSLTSKTHSTLNESKRRANEASRQLDSFRNRFIESMCKAYSLDSSVIKNSISKDATAESVETTIKQYVEKLDRYTSLPFSSSSIPSGVKILKENLKSSAEEHDEELETSKWFMESAGGVSNK